MMLLKTDFHFEKERLHFQVDFLLFAQKSKLKSVLGRGKNKQELIKSPNCKYFNCLWMLEVQG